VILDDARVIALVRGGNADAFAEIVKYYQAPIGRYLYQFTGDYEVAQDLVQETFLKAYQGILKTDSELSFKAWLYRIATNNALQYHRRRRLIRFIPFVDSTKKDIPTVEAPSGYVEERLAIEEALFRIPHDQKACMVLHFVEGFKYREIADVLGVTEDTVRKRVARGSKEFRRLYRQGGGEVK
jgi:RNA polymerase sigma-70 factor (ECF subfamily)